MASEEGTATRAHSPRQSAEQFKYSKRVVLRSILGREDGGAGLAGETVVVGGWVRSRKEKRTVQDVSMQQKATPVTDNITQDTTCCVTLISRIPLLRLMARRFTVRDHGPQDGKLNDDTAAKEAPAVHYLIINDGSCSSNLQVVVDSSMSLVGQVMVIGASILVEGVLEQPLVPGKHAVQLKVMKILHVGFVDPKKYPLAKTRLSLEYLRAYPHLRPRAAMVASISRVRNALSYATHMFFQNNGFLHVHMPIITTTDLRECDKMFQVTTLLLLGKPDDKEKLKTTNDREAISPEVVKSAISEKSKRIEELNRSDSNKEVLLQALEDLKKANELARQLEVRQKSTLPNIDEMDFSEDFFSRQAYLSVSSTLHLESYACALSSVYTFGPIFRTESSHSMKQLAEMWMVEVELAFAELEDVMNCAEDFLKFLCQSMLEKCSDDIKFTSKRAGKICLDHLQDMRSISFARITYTEAVDILKKEANQTFEAKVEWGINLSAEHESYLSDEIYKRPVIIYEYPKEVKPFYVRVNDDGKTVSAFDIIAPKVGGLIRGSQREERIDMIIARMGELGLPQEQYGWYLDLRRHGTVKHSGFSLGFENMVMLTTGVEDMRDAVPYPRTSGYASI